MATVFEVSVPRCNKVGKFGPQQVGTARGWECPVHGGINCVGRQSNLNLKRFRAAAAEHPVAQKVFAFIAEKPGASVSEIRRAVDPVANPGDSSVPRIIRYLRDAGLMSLSPAQVPLPPDFTVLDASCEHADTIDSLRGTRMVGRRCVSCRTLLPV